MRNNKIKVIDGLSPFPAFRYYPNDKAAVRSHGEAVRQRYFFRFRNGRV